MNRHFIVPKPCHKSWAELAGEGRKRFCEECSTPVHDYAQYSPQEWDRLWSESGGKVCGLLCGESAPEPRSRRAVLVGALLTTISPLMAQTGRLRIHVTDATGAGVRDAEAVLVGPDDKPIQTIRANESGDVLWTGLPVGDARFQIRGPGFMIRRLTVTVKTGEDMQVEARLDVGTVGTFVEVTPRRPWWRRIFR